MITSTRWLLPLVVGATLSLSACMSTIQPRSAEVAEPGEVAFGLYIPLSTVGFGETVAQGRTGPDQSPRSFKLGGTTTSVLDTGGAGPPPPPLSMEGTFQIGVFPRCELGAFGGPFRLGAEARCAMFSQRQGAPISVALAAGGAVMPFFDLKGPWLRAGLDLSRAFSNGMSLMINTYLSEGPEYRFTLNQVPVKFWDEPPDPNIFDDPGASFNLQRDETRLAVALGFGAGAEGIQFVVAVIPYFVLAADPIGAFECHRCQSVSPISLEETFGLTLTFGFEFRP